MATPKYTALATLTLTGSDSTIIFSSIPATYRDIVLVMNPLSSADNSVLVSLNGISTDFSTVRMLGYSSGTLSQTWTTNDLTAHQSNSSTVIMQFMDYAQTDKHKTILQRANFKSDSTAALAHRWARTDAISSITLNASLGFAAGATFDLFGVK